MNKPTQKECISLERYHPSPDIGLTRSQAAERKKQGLTNSVEKKYSKSYLSILIGNICTFFNLLGLCVCIALLAIGAPLSRFFFVVIYLANISIGIIQEIRAKLCIDKLSLLSSKNTKVIRDGQTSEILSSEIVLDDILLLGIGNQIPTDCKIISGDVEVNESLLTGESIPVKKKPGDELLAGSFIVSGTCTVQAVKVGKENYVEQLSAKAKKYRKPKSEIMSALRFFIKAVGVVIIPVAAAFLIKSMLIMPKPDWFTAIDGAATVVIGMIPSGMFLLTSLALAVGVIKLARHNTLVQDLYSLEMLARVDTICFDKTGTITDGKMTVQQLVPIADENELSGLSPEKIIGAMLGALKDNNQTAIALYNRFGQNNEYIAENVLPFNSARKLSAVTFENMGTFAFGAPEFVLSEEQYLKIKNRVNQYASEGLRVLVLARSESKLKENFIPDDFSPLSLILISDNVREDAAATIQWFKDNGVNIKVISGDNPITVSEVSKRVGIENAEKYISLEGMSDNEVIAAANEYTVFGRVSPEQKALLIKSIKAAGHVAAMTGDGVNDILALKEADCAVSVATGSDAARNISHLVLMDNNFSSLPKVVYEGRRVINNVQSSASLFLMKTFFVMCFAIITLCMPKLYTYPFTLSHMILLEVFVIGLPSFFLSLQANDSRVEGRFISQVISKSLPNSLMMVVSVIIIQIFASAIGTNSIATAEVYTTMQVFSLTLAGLISLYVICRPLNLYRSILFFANALVIFAVIFIAVFMGFTPLELCKMSPLSDFWPYLLIVLSVMLFDIPFIFIMMRLFSGLKLPTSLKRKPKTEA